MPTGDAPRGGRESVISVRLSPREEREIKRAAAERGEAVSSFLREAALSIARPKRRVTWSTNPITVATGGTVIPTIPGTIDSSRPTSLQVTAGATAEPIQRPR